MDYKCLSFEMILQKDDSKIFTDIAIRMGGLFFAKGLAFLTSIFIARLLGPKDFGHVSVAQSVLAVCGIFTGAGLVNAMLTYISKCKSDDIKWSYFLNAVALSFIVTITTIIIAFLIIYIVSPLSDKVGEVLALYCLPFLLFPNINQFLTNYVQSYGSVRIRTFMEVIGGSINSFTIMALTFLAGMCGWAMGMNAGQFIAVLILVIIFYKYLHKKNVQVTALKPKLDNNIIKTYLKYLRWSTLGTGLNVAMYGINSIIIIQIVKDASQVGIFSSAMLIFSAIGLYAQSITQSIYHKVAAKHEDTVWLKKIGIRMKLLALIPLGIFIIIASFLSNEIIAMIYGRKYDDAGPILSILIIASFFQNYIYLNGGIWIAIGRIKPHTMYFTLVSLGYLLLVIPLTAMFSIKGTSYAMLFSVIFGAIISEMINYRYIWSK